LDLHLPITDKEVKSISTHGKMYSIQTFCDKICQLIAACQWFSTDTLIP